MAIERAQELLSWQENLQPDEMPPRWMWHLDWELNGWFEDLKAKRDAQRRGGGREPEEEAAMTGNELTKGLRRG